jgi:hypothetical protein
MSITIEGRRVNTFRPSNASVSTDPISNPPISNSLMREYHGARSVGQNSVPEPKPESIKYVDQDIDISSEIEKGNVKRLTQEELQLAISEGRFLRETTKEETKLIEEKLFDKLNRLKAYHEAKIDTAENSAFVPDGMSNENWEANVNRSKKVKKLKDELIGKINNSKTDEELYDLIDSRLAEYEKKDMEKYVRNFDNSMLTKDEIEHAKAANKFYKEQEQIKADYALLIEQKKEDRIKDLATDLIKRNNRTKKLEKYIFPWIVYICIKPIVGRKMAEHVGFFCYYFKITISMLITILLLLILFAIGVTLYLVIQASLDAGHLVIGGVGNGLKTAVDKAAFRIFGKTIKFLGFLEGPANKVIKANNSFPFHAWELIILLIKPYFKGLL